MGGRAALQPVGVHVDDGVAALDAEGALDVALELHAADSGGLTHGDLLFRCSRR